MPEQQIKQQIASTFLELAELLETGQGKRIPIALTALGSEHGEPLLYQAAQQAADQGIAVQLIGSTPLDHPGVTVTLVKDETEGHKALESLLESGTALGGVTMHYPFPIGVTTIGKVVAPANGRDLYIASATGTSAVDRVEAMIRNAIYGIATAKACGNPAPTVGILNVEGAPQVLSALEKLQKNGYPIHFANSSRSGGGALMRGNDILVGAPDILVTDSLTGNVVTKLLSAYTTGGNYESVGYGYGPGIGENFSKLILIISRASGIPVVAKAMKFAAQLVQGNWQQLFTQELSTAKAAGLAELLAASKPKKSTQTEQPTVAIPPKQVVTEEIPGIDILSLEEAATHLWAAGIYAESGMGCTGPVLLIAPENAQKSLAILKEKAYL